MKKQIKDCIIIKEMCKEDLNDIVKLEKECFSTPWSYNSLNSELKNKISKFFVAKLYEKLIGYVGVYIILDEAYITNIAVSSKYRSNGIGGKLIKKLFCVANELNLSFLSLEVRESNFNAIKFYEFYGFIKVGHRRKFYKMPIEDAIIMTKYFNVI